MENGRVVRVVSSMAASFALVISIASFVNMQKVEARLKAQSAPAAFTPSEIVTKVPVDAPKPSGSSYEDILNLAKKGGKVECFAIFYNDRWEKPDPNPYSLTVEYADDLCLEVNDQKSLETIYIKLRNMLLALHRIAE